MTNLVGSDACTVTVTGEQTAVGTYTATASALSNANYKLPAANTQSFSISDAAITGITATGYNATYDGAAHGISVTAPDGVTIKYGTVDGTYDLTSSPTYTDVGTYTVYYEVSQANYTAVTGSQTVVIGKKTLTVIADAKGKTYGEADPALTYTSDGLVGTDALTGALTRSSGEDVGTYAITQGTLAASDNYTIAFTGASLTITPLTGVIVTIIGHNNTATFDGTEHKVSGYKVDGISNDLYTEADFIFSGTAEAKRTEPGMTSMGLDASQFTNTNTNFDNVTFNVTDGYQKITSPDEVIVRIIGHTSTTDYDGKEHEVSGYEVKISNDLYKESDFTFTGTAEAKRTDAGKTEMGLDASLFENTNPNFGSVTFDVTDGYQEISPITATVTITGHNSTVTYDGEEHSVSGYDVTFSNDLYKEEYIAFSGTAEAKRTDEGTTYMGLAADQFTNTSANFSDVTFNVEDGYVHITSITDVVVTITGRNNTVDYDGKAHSVSGYDVEISNNLYKESDFTFSGTAEATRTDAGTTTMGLDASQFTNINSDFASVTFKVTDGYQIISPIRATVAIKGHSDIVVYDGTEHKVSGYDVETSNPLYKESDFTFSGTANAARTDQGTTEMGLAADQFTNNNANFSTVTFNVTDGYQTIKKKVAVLTVTVTPKTYDGKTDAEVSVTVDTRVKGESMTITGLTGAFDTANAGTDKTVAVNSSKAVVTVGENTKLDNYEVVYPTQANGTITQRPVVVSGITARDKDYDGKTDATLVFDNVQFDGLLAGDNLTVTATGKFETAAAGENKTVLISNLTLGGESVDNYMLAAEGQQTTTTATIRQVGTIDRRHSGIEVRRNDTNELVDNDAFLTVMDDGTLRIDQVTIINPDAVNGIAAGVSIYIPATLKDFDGTTGTICGVGSDIIITEAIVPVTGVYMPDTEEMINVAAHAFRLDPSESKTARIHTPLALLDDYALCAGLKAEYEAGNVMTTVTTTTQYWTLSCGVDIVVPEGLTAHICQADGITAVAAIAIKETTANVDGKTHIIVKANNGVMMGGAIGSYDLRAWPSADRPSGMTPPTEDAHSYEGNELEPAIVKTHFIPTEYYILYNNVFHELQPTDNTSVSPCKAVLRKSNPAMARSLAISVDSESAGISTVVCDDFAADGKWYTIDGQRLDGKPTKKGLYIRNGVKVIMK